MGRSGHCSKCVNFFRETESSNWGCTQVVEVPGPCSSCQQRHANEVRKLEAKFSCLQIEFDREKRSYETVLAELKEKSVLDLRNQKAEYEKLLMKLKPLPTSEANSQKAVNNRRSEFCFKCVNSFRETQSSNWGSRSVVEVPEPCSNCHQRHGHEVRKLEAKFSCLQIEFDLEKENHATDLAELKEKSMLDLRNQKAEYEELLMKLKRLPTFEVNSQLSQIEFLKVRRDSQEGDVILATSDSRIFAHGAILAAKSPAFEKFLRKETAGTETKGRPVIQIDGISSLVLEAIVDFCYCGEITFSEFIRPEEVFKVAHTFEIGFLKEFCEAELCEGLNVGNVPQMLKLSRDYAALRLQKEAGKVFQENFDLLHTKVYEALEVPRV